LAEIRGAAEALLRDASRSQTLGEEPAPPAELRAELDRTFEVWIGADQACLAVRIEVVRCLPEGKPRQTAARELAARCAGILGREECERFPAVLAWYGYLRGRALALAGDEAAAEEAWTLALEQGDPAAWDATTRVRMNALRHLVLHAWIKSKVRTQAHADVVRLIEEIPIRYPDLRLIFDTDLGKELLLDYARSLTAPPEAGAAEFEKAIGRLREALEKER